MIQDFLKQFLNIPRMFLLAGPLILSLLYITENGKKTKTKVLQFFKQYWKALFALYFAFVLSVTVFFRQSINPYQKVFMGFLFFNGTSEIKEAIENILLFVPYSFFFLQAYNTSHPWKSSLMLSVLSAVSIEMCQLIFWLGFFQIADVIHNTMGGVIGYLIWGMKKIIREKQLLGIKGKRINN